MPQIIVTHPCKQYAHRLVYSLQQAGYLRKFITAIWYKPGAFPYKIVEVLPPSLSSKILKELYKKSFFQIENSNVEQFPYFELFRELLERKTNFKYLSNLMYFRNRVHDRYVSWRLNNYQPDIVIGYETSSKITFKSSREKGIVTVLDLAQVHYKYADEALGKFTNVNNDIDLLNQVNAYKQKEIESTDYFLVLSEFAKNTLIDNDIPADRIYKVNLGYDKDVFYPKDHYVNNEKLKILYVGSVTKRKGIELLLEVFNELDSSDIELTIIGSVADIPINMLEGNERLKHVNFSSQDELAKHYRQADIFVFPSYMDSWAMVVVEAMACGTPVIVSENTGSKELVMNGVNGFVIKTGSKPELKEKILFFNENRHMIKSFGEKASESVQNSTWEDYSRNIIAIMDDISKRENIN